MGSPNEPTKFLQYVERQRESHLGKIPWNKNKFVNYNYIVKRFNSKYTINKNTYCWEWKGFIFKTGYGQFWDGKKDVFAHRFSYELFNGKIPELLTIDHICKNRKCVNPHHLDLVTRIENVMRSENKIAHNKQVIVCPRGHNYDSKNTRFTKEGFRQCRKCSQINKKKSRQKLRGVGL